MKKGNNFSWIWERLMGTNLLYGFIICLCLVLFGKSYSRYQREKKQYQFLKQFLQFIQQVKQLYFLHGMIEDAIFEALYEVEGQVLEEGEKIYDMLCSGREVIRKQYMGDQKNPFVKLFAALASIEMQYGNTRERNVFLECIQMLKQDIVIELRKREKMKELFAGLSFLVLFPAFFLKLIEQWGISNIPELKQYYNGAFGIVALVGIFLVISITWWLIEQIRFLLQKEEREERTYTLLKKLEEQSGIQWALRIWEKNRNQQYQREGQKLQRLKTSLTPEQFLLRRILVGGLMIALSIGVVSCYLWNEKRVALSGKELWRQESLAHTGMLEDRWYEGVQYVQEKYKEETRLNETIVWQELYDYYNKTNTAPANIGLMQIQKNIQKYQRSRWTAGKVIFLMIMGFFGWQLPKWILWYEAFLRKQAVEHELFHYETIIMILSKIKQVDEFELLEWLEEGSRVYKEQWEWCLLSAYGGEESAFLWLKDESEQEIKQPIITVIADSLLLSDQIGLEKAFEDMSVYRKNDQEQQKQENERNIQKYGMLSQMLAFCPLCFVIGIYLIVPFVMESLVQLSGFLQQLYL